MREYTWPHDYLQTALAFLALDTNAKRAYLVPDFPPTGFEITEGYFVTHLPLEFMLTLAGELCGDALFHQNIQGREVAALSSVRKSQSSRVRRYSTNSPAGSIREHWPNSRGGPSTRRQPSGIAPLRLKS